MVISPVLLLAFMQAGAPAKTYDLIWRPKPGQVFRYRLNLSFKIETTDVDIDADLQMTVRKRDPKGGFELETRTKNLRVMSGEDVQRLPDGAPVVEKYDVSGRRTSAAGGDLDDPLAQVMDSATDFTPPPVPVKIGQKWSRVVPEGKAKMDYRLLGSEKLAGIPVLRVRFAYAQSAGEPKVKSDGYLLLNERDYAIVSTEATLRNVRVSKDAEPTTVVVKLRRAF